jgi:hypothetical protein
MEAPASVRERWGIALAAILIATLISVLLWIGTMIYNSIPDSSSPVTPDRSFSAR